MNNFFIYLKLIFKYIYIIFKRAQHPGLLDNNFLLNSLNNTKLFIQQEKLQIIPINKNITLDLNKNFTQTYMILFNNYNQTSLNWEIDLIHPRNQIMIFLIKTTASYKFF